MSRTPGRRRARRVAALLAACAAVVPLAACGGGGGPVAGGLLDEAACARNAGAGTITYVSGYGYSASAGQLDVFLAEELGYFDDLCLDVEINDSGANGQQLVSSGRARFTALGSASDVMLAASAGGDLTAVA
ncbi:ABC transporter substrate-binding protein, partial [Leucobacter sp.]